MAKPTIYIDESYTKKDGMCKLYIRYYLNAKYVHVPIGIDAPLELWDKKKLQIKGKGFQDKNLLISRALGTASDIILKYQVNNKPLTKELFIKEFSNPAVLTEFNRYAIDQIKMRQGELAESSVKQQLSIINKLKRYKEEILMTEIDEDFLRNYQKYLYKSLNLDVNSVYNNMKVLKTYMSKAVRMGLIAKNPFLFFKLKRIERMPEFLSIAERDTLLELYNSNKLPDIYRNVLRWFLFSCYTGLRISDLRAVTFENLDGTTLKFYPKKSKNTTNIRVEIPLTVTALKLISDEAQNSGLLFRCVSQQRMNRKIKEVCKLAKIDKNVTFHTARHTFATIFLQRYQNANGILILQKLLGHSKLASTIVYSHILNDNVRDAMSQFE